MSASASTSVKASPNPIVANSTSSGQYSEVPTAAARNAAVAASEDVRTR